MKAGKVNVLIDGQWGSTGKGKLAGFLSHEHSINLVTMAAQPQAGHTYVDRDGKKIVAYHIPISGIVGLNTPMIILNAGSTIDIDKLLGEIESFGVGDRLLIHPHAAVVQPQDKTIEQHETKRIASTMQGTGSATARKVMRTAKVAKDFKRLKPWISNKEYLERFMFNALKDEQMVLAESTQGFDLSLNFGMYPHCTSRDITVSSILATACVPPGVVGDVYSIIRTFPIRVGNIDDENQSGPCYPDQRELTWDEVTKLSGSKEPIVERTTVTKRIRRVFTFSELQFHRFCRQNAPDFICVNFINYVNAEDKGIKSQLTLSSKSMHYLRRMQSTLRDIFGQNAPIITYVGTGARQQDMIVVKS